MRCVTYHKFALARRYPPRAAVRGAARLPGRTIHPMPPVGFWEAFRFWLRLGFLNFGGATRPIAIMHHELVERRRWISNERFLHALSYCMLLPGPEATQLATYIGWLLHRTAGGLAAGVLFVLPAFFFMLGLSWLYAVHGKLFWVAAIFSGLRAGVIAIVAAAVIRIGVRALRTPAMVAPAPLEAVFSVRDTPVIRDDLPAPAHTRPTLRRALLALVVGLAAWWGPLAVVAAWRGPSDVLTREAIFFSKAALVTFGGAYAVLVYIAQAAVQQYGWLAPGEMLDGLGLAETTPGPLIMVTQFVGFLGAFRHPGGLDPVAAGTLGALVTVWATFAPSFLFIFLGAPYIEHVRGHVVLTVALAAITAAVVGVILNLAVWFGLHTLFRTVTETSVLAMTVPVPRLATLDLPALALAVAAFVALWRFRLGIVPVVLGSAVVGLLWRFAGL